MILHNDRKGDELAGREPTLGQWFPRSALQNDALAGAARQLGPAGDESATLRGDDVQAPALIVPNFKQDAPELSGSVV